VGKQDFAFRRFNEYIPGYTLYQIKKCPIPGSEKMFPTKLEAQQLFSPESFGSPKSDNLYTGILHFKQGEILQSPQIVKRGEEKRYYFLTISPG
jgi:hypothetical protein